MPTNNCNDFTNPISVNTGGTGASSFTAYSVLCGGTTATGPLQNVSGIGSSTQVLTSNGAGALPTWQAAPSGSTYALTFMSTGSVSGTLADGGTYFMRSDGGFSTASGNGLNQYLIVPKNSTITGFAGNFYWPTGAILASNENCTFNIRINNTTNVAVTTTLQLTTALVIFSNSSLSQSVNAGDFLELTLVCPTWATNPSNVTFYGAVYLT